MVTACRLVLVAVFGTAAAAKISDRNGGAGAAVALGVPERLAGAVNVLLPVTELIVAAALLFGPTTVAGAVVALALLVAFTVFVDRKSTRLNSSHIQKSRMPSSA